MRTLFSKSEGKPGVIVWYLVYCAAMAFMFVALAIIGVGALFLSPFLNLGDSLFSVAAIGIVYIVAGLLLTAPFVAAPFLPARPWVWVYGIVMIALGMTSCCCLPASIPLLIFWIKPETKHFFGRP